jgi:hypothetical protein
MAYCSVTQVKNYAQVNKTETGKESYKDFGFSSQAAFDTWLTELIDWADKQIDAYVEHDFTRHPTTGTAAESFDGTGSRFVFPKFPILTVTQIRFRSGLTHGSWATVVSDDYQAFDRYIALGRKTPVGHKNVEVTYAYGHAFVPSVVAMASVRMATNVIQGCQQRAISPVVKIGDFVIEQAKEEAFSDGIKATLIPYRRIPQAVSVA